MPLRTPLPRVACCAACAHWRCYGFLSMESKRMFLHLLKVNGIGPKVAPLRTPLPRVACCAACAHWRCAGVRCCSRSPPCSAPCGRNAWQMAIAKENRNTVLGTAQAAGMAMLAAAQRGIPVALHRSHPVRPSSRCGPLRRCRCAMWPGRRLAKAPGLGKKGAQKIILELKGSIDFAAVAPAEPASTLPPRVKRGQCQPQHLWYILCGKRCGEVMVAHHLVDRGLRGSCPWNPSACSCTCSRSTGSAPK